MLIALAIFSDYTCFSRPKTLNFNTISDFPEILRLKCDFTE